MLYDKRWELDEVGKVLDAAADYIEGYGWCQYKLEDGRGRACLMGALLRVWSDETIEHRYAVLDRLAGLLGRSVNSIALWNDAPGRTKEEVIAALRGAARFR